MFFKSKFQIGIASLLNNMREVDPVISSCVRFGYISVSDLCLNSRVISRSSSCQFQLRRIIS
jgi:hypothetical protein